MKSTNEPANKIDLDISVFCPNSVSSIGGKKDCDHNYPTEPNFEGDSYAYWICTKCGIKTYYDVWD